MQIAKSAMARHLLLRPSMDTDETKHMTPLIEIGIEPTPEEQTAMQAGLEKARMDIKTKMGLNPYLQAVEMKKLQDKYQFQRIDPAGTEPPPPVENRQPVRMTVEEMAKLFEEEKP